MATGWRQPPIGLPPPQPIIEPDPNVVQAIGVLGNNTLFPTLVNVGVDVLSPISSSGPTEITFLPPTDTPNPSDTTMELFQTGFFAPLATATSTSGYYRGDNFVGPVYENYTWTLPNYDTDEINQRSNTKTEHFLGLPDIASDS